MAHRGVDGVDGVGGGGEAEIHEGGGEDGQADIDSHDDIEESEPMATKPVGALLEIEGYLTLAIR